jgi:hypothetical protein
VVSAETGRVTNDGVVLVSSISEDEMIAAFLRAEIDSPRHGGLLMDAVNEIGVGIEVIEHPDCAVEYENEIRRAVLATYRGWGTYESVFGGLPTKTLSWWSALLERSGFERVEVIQWLVDEYPDAFPVRPLRDLRVLKQAAWRAGGSVASTAEALRHGARPAPPILVSTPDLERLVILEGHTRMQAYALLGEDAPEVIEIILGTSPDVHRWSEW